MTLVTLRNARVGSTVYLRPDLKDYRPEHVALVLPDDEDGRAVVVMLDLTGPGGLILAPRVRLPDLDRAVEILAADFAGALVGMAKSSVRRITRSAKQLPSPTPRLARPNTLTQSILTADEIDTLQALRDGTARVLPVTPIPFADDFLPSPGTTRIVEKEREALEGAVHDDCAYCPETPPEVRAAVAREVSRLISPCPEPLGPDLGPGPGGD